MAATDATAKHRRTRGGLRTGLAAACTLVGIHAAPAQPVDVDTSLLVYKEPSRVGVVEALLEAKRDFGFGRSGGLKLVLDSLTGASANGATPSSQVQTFTSPSGSSAYTTEAGKTPLDNTFSDTRLALDGNYTLPLDRLTNLGLGANVSVERDYTSLGASSSLSRDFFKRNTTLTASASASHDLVRPMGGRPVAFDVMPPPGSGGREDEGGNRPGTLGDGTKNVADLAFGVTQILDRRTLIQMNYNWGHVGGYQTDPYKLLSVVNPQTGDPTEYLYEKRPDSRRRQGFYGRLKHHFGWSVLDLSHRYYWDDWGIRSHTTEVRWRWGLGGSAYLQPHLRYYHQTAADFYRRYLLSGDALPSYASADYRLGELTARTVGLEFGKTLPSGHSVTMRGEYYWQTGDNHPADAPIGLQSYDLFPKVDAFIFQVGYSFDTQ